MNNSSLFFLKVFNTNNSYEIEYSPSYKFKNDMVNYQDESFTLILDGVVLNKKELLSKSSNMDWASYLLQSYIKNGDTFFDKLRGSFYGCLIDKKKNKIIVFADHISSKRFYYTNQKDSVLFSNNYGHLLKRIKDFGGTTSLNIKASYLLLTYGYTFEDITITNEIKRLMVGQYALIQDGILKLLTFFTLRNTPIRISENEAIEEIDFRFREAIKLAFNKDKEYGYKHIAALSGGLDSRMTVWVAHELGYTDQLNITFSQSNYLDETIPKQIAAELKHEWLFKALDNGLFLMDIDEVSKLTGGNVLYYGIAHGVSLYKYLNFENLGLIHSGQLGDVVIGSFNINKNTNEKYKIGDGAYSKKILHTIKDIYFKVDYPNVEIFKMYIRGFYGANQGLVGVTDYSETYSPFYDVDFMSFALSIPVELRINHYLYKKWIIEKYPNAAKYIWEKEKVPVNYKYMLKIRNKNIPLNQIGKKFLNRLGANLYGSDSKNYMNPLNYYNRTNTSLKAYMDDYFDKNINNIHFSSLRNECVNLYKNALTLEKIQVLSLLSAIKVNELQ